MSRAENYDTNNTLMYIGRVFFVICTLLILCSNSSFQNIYGKTSERVTIHDLLPFDPAASEKSPLLNASTNNSNSSSLGKVGIGNSASLKNGSIVSTIEAGMMTDHTITVSGSGSLKVKPNLANIHLSLTTIGNSAETAYAANLAILQKITGGIKNTGAKNDKTDTFAAQNLTYTVSFNQENATKKAVTRSIWVKATNMTAASILIDKALKAGASVDRIQFGLSEDKLDEQRVNVMELALGDAWKKARDAATLLDVRVVGIKSLSIDTLSFGNEAQFPNSSITSFGASLIPSSVDLVMNVTQSFLFKERS